MLERLCVWPPKWYNGMYLTNLTRKLSCINTTDDIWSGHIEYRVAVKTSSPLSNWKTIAEFRSIHFPSHSNADAATWSKKYVHTTFYQTEISSYFVVLVTNVFPLIQNVVPHRMLYDSDRPILPLAISLQHKHHFNSIIPLHRIMLRYKQHHIIISCDKERAGVHWSGMGRLDCSSGNRCGDVLDGNNCMESAWPLLLTMRAYRAQHTNITNMNSINAFRKHRYNCMPDAVLRVVI